MKYPPEQVIAAIQARQQQGLPLSRVWQDDPWLHAVARRRFGNWSKALAAAGFQARPQRHWTKELVLKALHHWYRTSAIAVARVDPGLHTAVYKYCGSMKQALQELGLEPKHFIWTEKRVIEQIQDRYIRGLSLSEPTGQDRKLAGAAQRRFGSWRTAVAAAGLLDKMPPEKPTKKWTPQNIIRALRSWRRQGIPSGHIKKKDPDLYVHAKKYFHGWKSALHAAGWLPTTHASKKRPQKHLATGGDHDRK
jgi:hypothetical protein